DDSDPVDLTASLDAIGSFTLPLTQLADLAGMPLSEGKHHLVLSAMDNFGNAAPDQKIDFTIKTIPPAVPTQPVVRLADGSPAGGTTTQQTLIAETTAGVNSIVRLYRDGVQVANAVADGTPVEFGANLGLLGDGTYTFTATAEDFTGNVSAFSAGVTV